MTTLDDLKTVITARPLASAETEVILVLDAETEIDETLHCLNRYFAADHRRTAVQLHFQDKPLGYLNRRDFYSASSGTLSRSGLGKAQGAELAGDQAFTFIQLACPVAGCKTRILKIHYDEQDPPNCPRHPDKTLQVVI